MNRRQKLLVAALLAADVLLSTSAYALRPYKRKYKYYLDANRAEQILGSIAIQPQLREDDWLQIVGPMKEEQYTIRRGDTLWGISGRQFGNARLWRKLWEVNAYLSNPHDLSAGQILQYYREGDRLAAAGSQIPMIKLVPGGRKGGYDLDSDEFYQKDLRNRFRPAIQIVREQDIVGEISGSYAQGEWIRELDPLYLSFIVPNAVRKGDRFTIVRYERTLVDTTQKSRPVLGFLMRLLGEVKVTGFGETLVTAELVGAYAPVQRGDSIVPLRMPTEVGDHFNPPNELQPRVLAGETPERANFADGDLVLLNKGQSEGMRDGLLFRVYDDKDPYTKRRGDTEPSFKAEVQVVQIGQDASVAVVKRATLPVQIGDTLVPTQAFPDREKVHGRQTQSLEID